jgi:hypothetical protein
MEKDLARLSYCAAGGHKISACRTTLMLIAVHAVDNLSSCRLFSLLITYTPFIVYLWGCSSGFEAFGVNRKFQSGKQAKKRAEAMTHQREEQARIAAEENSEEAVRTREVMDTYKEMRGPSLMEAHFDKKAKTPKIVSTERRPFDREKVGDTWVYN